MSRTRISPSPRQGATKRLRLACVAGAAASVLTDLNPLHAATTVWIGPSGGNWVTAANWTLGQPTAADTARFPTGGTGIIVNLSSGRFANSLFFQGDYGLTGGSLALGSGVINADTGTSSIIASSLIALSGSGTQGLTKNGAGALRLNTSNTFQGTVTVNAGTLTVSSDSRLGNSANPVVINGGTLEITSATSTARTYTITGTSAALDAASGALTLTGTITAQSGGIASTSDANIEGTVTVNGAGSSWTDANQADIGALGNGVLNVQNGAAASAPINVLGNGIGSTGQAVIDGAGSTWTSAALLEVGLLGNGTLTAQTGGDVASVDALVGHFAGSTGTVTVSGAGSTLTVSDDLAVGLGGRGTLTVQNDADASSVRTHIGSEAGSNGTLTVTGVGSTWTTTAFVGVGYAGQGTLNIESGATVNSNFAWIGSETGSNGIATVTGSGSSWIFSGAPIVGERGTATLTVSAGGTLTCAGADIGRTSTGRGTVTVTGSTSSWSNSSFIRIGWGGRGTVNILAGADATVTSSTEIGLNSGATGTLIVNGSGSTWTSGGNLSVGEFGDGILNIEAGGVVSNAAGVVGASTGGTGAVLVTGAGSKWINTGDLEVGDAGNGSLTIQSGGSVSCNFGYIGNFGNGVGVLNVDGSGSNVTCNTLVVGGTFAGHGTLNVTGGADIVSTYGHVGLAGVGTATGTATVTGAGSTWITSNLMNVGYQAIGTLNVELGGVVVCTGINLGDGASANGTVNVSGTGSLWSVTSGGMQMSRNNGAGTLNVTGGTVNVIGGIVDHGAGISTINLDGGVLNLNNYNIGFGNPVDNLLFRSGTLRNVNSINNGAGWTKTSTGVLTLDGNNNFAGPVTVSQGTLILKTSLLNNQTMNVANGAIAQLAKSATTPNNVVLVTGAVVTNTTGVLDLVDNKLVVTAANSIGSWNGSTYTGITGLIAQGRNGGFWNGSGITTSMTDATNGSNYTMLGVARASEARGIAPAATDLWANVGVFGSDTLVMYTYGGDANLSGFVDIDDYGQIDFNASTGGALTGWFNGDFDYNGIQDIDDYGIIDFVVNIQGAPFAGASFARAPIASVPEPAVGTLAIAALLLRRKRRR